MARISSESCTPRNGKKNTSIGNSRRTKPKNKSKRRSFKKSRGQGS